MSRLRAAAALLALGTCGLGFAAEPLSLAQIEKVTGLSGLSARPGKYDKSATSFYTGANELAVSVKVAPAAVYEVWKSHPSMNDQAPLSGLGEDAVSSRTGRYVCFRKGSTGVCVTGMVAPGGGQVLVSDAKLLELARLAASGL